MRQTKSLSLKFMLMLQQGKETLNSKGSMDLRVGKGDVQ